MIDILDTKQLTKNMVEWSTAELKIEAEKDLQSSIKDTAAEKLGISKGDFQAMAKLYHMKIYHSDKYDKEAKKGEYFDVVDSLEG